MPDAGVTSPEVDIRHVSMAHTGGQLGAMTEASTRVDLRGRVALAGKVGDQKALLPLAKNCRGDDRPECPILDDFESEPEVRSID
jgi:hypothetical protein